MKGTALILSAIVAVCTAAVQCPTEGQEVDLILQHNDCNKFYKCISGQAVEQSCSNDLHFNVESSQCDLSENVVCGTRKVPESEDVEQINNSLWWLIPGWPWQKPTTPKPEPQFLDNGCPVDPQTHWLVPHEFRCNLFYSCVWGERVLQKCPRTLFFNPRLQVCDWPWKAGCRPGRPRP